MSKPNFIKLQDLPLEKIGFEKSTGFQVYKFTGSLNSNVLLSLNYQGIERKHEVVLGNGSTVSNVWLQRT